MEILHYPKFEEERQFFVQVVANYRKQFPDVKKSTLNQPSL